uniref:Transmembrane protein n=1 Tax=Nelumbo nucifera TaxID=4432 RepID=A0A822YH32_NELNU|nr:TPA_asm: hypothetical protein HUJ06_010603 [Nelumbo nucifera]
MITRVLCSSSALTINHLPPVSLSSPRSHSCCRTVRRRDSILGRRRAGVSIITTTTTRKCGGVGDEEGTPMWSSTMVCKAQKATTSKQPPEHRKEDGQQGRVLQQLVLWTAEGVYIVWLFLLPYAPGDPVWAISSDTENSIVGLSLNFFFILPSVNSVGIHLMEAPVLHPVSEALFNFVIGWTFMFAPLLFTDCKRDRYKGSLDVLWGLQMFLTNTFLIPYMAIRLNEADSDYAPRKPSKLGSVMTNGAAVVGLIGGAMCVLSALWAFFGRMDSDFGTMTDRWEFLLRYLGSERLAYAFIWDIFFYIIFQPWLIGDNLQNVQQRR